MKTFQRLPLPVLRPFIDRLWGWESAPGENIRLPVLLPGTGAELYFHYRAPFRYLTRDGREESCAPAYLFCLRREPVRLLPCADTGFVAVRFRVGMIHRFTPIPGAELRDRVLSAGQLWGRAGAELSGRFGEAETLDERLALLQSFLVSRLERAAPDPLVEKAMALLYRRDAPLAIRTLAEKLHLGRRQLERRFMALAGQSPGELRSLSRFQHTVRKLMLDGSAAPLETALAQGYYDQAHFIRDFRQLAGVTPRQYLADARAKTHFYNTSRRAAGTLRAPDPLS